MSYQESLSGSESEFNTHQSPQASSVGPSQLLSPSQTHAGATTRYSASLSADSQSIIESSANDDDSVASIDVQRVGFTPRTSMALSEDDGQQQHQQQHYQQQQYVSYSTHPYADSYGHSPYIHGHEQESLDGEEYDVEQMLLHEQDPDRSYHDQGDYEHIPPHQRQYADIDIEQTSISGRSYSERESEEERAEEFGLQPEWPHVLSVDEVRNRRTSPLSVILEVRSSLGSRSQASGMASRPLSGAFEADTNAPPVPSIPSHLRQPTDPLPSRGGESSPHPSGGSAERPTSVHSGRSLHSRASTDPGQALRSIPSVPSSREARGGIKDKIAFFEDKERSASPALPSLVHGARPGSPSGTHGLGLGLGLSLGRPSSLRGAGESVFPQPQTAMLSPGSLLSSNTHSGSAQSIPSPSNISPQHSDERRGEGEAESSVMSPVSTRFQDPTSVMSPTSTRYQEPTSVMSPGSTRLDPTSTSYVSQSRPPSYASSSSGSGVLVSAPRSASPTKSGSGSLQSWHSSEASSINIPSPQQSYSSLQSSQPSQGRSDIYIPPSQSAESLGIRATSALIQSVSDDILSRHLQAERRQTPHPRDPRSTSPLGQQPQTGYVQRILQSLKPVEQEGGPKSSRPEHEGLFRRQSLRRASGGAAGSGHGHERTGSTQSAGREQGSGNGGPRSEGDAKSLRGSGEGSLGEGMGIPGGEEPLRVGTLWYLHVHTGDENYRWIKCKAVLFRTQLQLTWVEAGGGKAIIGLDLLNCHEVRSVPSPNHASARDDIGNVVARRQATEEGQESIAELAPFQMLYEDGVERLGAGSPRERVRWVAAIWDALNRASIVPSRTSSPAPSIGTIPSQRSTSSSSKAGSASTVFIPADEEIPDMGSTISSLTQSSFHSAPRSSELRSSYESNRSNEYQSSSYISGSYHTRPRSVDDSSLLSPEMGRFAITPSRSSSLRRTSSMTDLDEYASAAPASETHPIASVTATRTYRSHSQSETTYLSQSYLDQPSFYSRGSPSQTSLGVPRTIASSSQRSSATSSPGGGRPLPALPPLESMPSISSISSSGITGRYDTPAGTVATAARRFETPSSDVRSGGTAVPLPAAPRSASPLKSDRGSTTGTNTSFLTAPPAPILGRRTPTTSTDSGHLTYTPADSGPVRRIRAGKASSIYSLASLNEQERHRLAAEESSTIDEYGSILSSPAPSAPSLASASPRPTTPKLLGTTVLPRLSYRGPESASLLGDSVVTSPAAAASTPTTSGGTPGRPYATSRAPPRLSRIVEMPTGASATSLVRAIPGARPRSARFERAKSNSVSSTFLTAEEREGGGASSSDEWATASEKTPTKSSPSGDSITSMTPSMQTELKVEREQSSSESSSDIHSDIQENGSEGDEDDQRPRLARQDSYYTSTSAGIARQRSMAGDSTYSGLDICMSSDISEITPLSGSSEQSFTPHQTPQPATPIQLPAPVEQQRPVSVFSSPYYTADEAPSSPISVGGSSIPTIKTESGSERSGHIESTYATPIEQVDTSLSPSTALRWPSSSEYITASSPSRHAPTISPAPSTSVPLGVTPSHHTPSASPSPSVSVPFGAVTTSPHTPSVSPATSASVPLGAATSSRHTPSVSPTASISVPYGATTPSRHTPSVSPTTSVSVPLDAPTPSRHTPSTSPTASISVPFGHTPSQHTPSASPPSSLSVPIALSDPKRSATPASASSTVSVPRISSPLKRSPTPASVSPSISVPTLASPARLSASISSLSASSPHITSAEGTPTPSIIPSIPDAESEFTGTSEEPSSESSVTPTQSRTMSLASRSIVSSPISTPVRESTPRSVATRSTALPTSTIVSSESSVSSTTVSSVTPSPLPSPVSSSSKTLSSVTSSLKTPTSFLMPPPPPPSSTRSKKSRSASEVSWAPSSEESMSSSQFEYTPSAVSSGLPPIDETLDSSMFNTPSMESSIAGGYEVVVVESTEGQPSSSGGSSTPKAPVSLTTSIAMQSTPSQLHDSLSPSSLTRSDTVSSSTSVSSLRSSIFLPSRSSSIRSVAPPASASSVGTPRSPTVSVTMTPAQSFHPSFRDDLSTVPSEEGQPLAVATAPMEIITHDVNRLLEYLDGVDHQRVAEHDDVKNQLDRLEDGLKRLSDFVREEAAKPPPVVSRTPQLPETPEDVVVHQPPAPAVVLLDVRDSPLKLSSGSVTESVQWLSSPSSMSEGLPVSSITDGVPAPPSSVHESPQPSSITASASLRPSNSVSQRSAPILPSLSASSPSLQPSDLASQESTPIIPSSASSVSLRPSDSVSQRSAPILPSSASPVSLRPSDLASQRSASVLPSSSASSVSLQPSDSASQRSAPVLPSPTSSILLQPSDSASQRSAPILPSSSTSPAALQPSLVLESPRPSSVTSSSSLRPSDSASQRSVIIPPSESVPLSPSSEASTIRDVRSIDGESEGSRPLTTSEVGSGILSVGSEGAATPSSLSIPGAPPPSAGSTPPPSVPSGSPLRTPLDTPPRTRGNTPDISIVSASGRTSPARSDITIRAAVSNAQLRDMLHDLREQTDKLIQQQRHASDAIQELQNRPPVQLPTIPTAPTPRRSPYADLLSQIADTLKSIVDAGEAARELPPETETETESIAETSDTGETTRLHDLQNRLQDVLGEMPTPPRHVIPSAAPPATTMADVSPNEEEGSDHHSPSASSASLFEQHVADFPRIRRPIPHRAHRRSPSPTIITRPGTAPIPSAPTWGRPQTIYTTPTPPRQQPLPAEEVLEESPVEELPSERRLSGDSGTTIDLLRELQRRRKERRGGDGTFIPGGEEVVEEIPEPIPRPDTAPVEFHVPDEPVTKTWYSKRPKSRKPSMIFGDQPHVPSEPSEPPSPPKTPITIPQEPRQPARPTIPLGELPSSASYAEMLALLRQNELMQRHQNEQQNELVRYLHDLNGWLARDVNNRQMELQGVEDRIAHLQNALAARGPAYVPYVPEQDRVVPHQPPRMAHVPQTRFGDPEGDDGIIPPPPMTHIPYGRPGPIYAPPVTGYPPYPSRFGEPESPPIMPSSRHHSRMPMIEIRGAIQQPSRPPRSPSPTVHVPATTVPPATVPDPSRADSPPRSSRPTESIPPVIQVNMPSRRHSRSPDYDRESWRGRPRTPSHRLSRAITGSPEFLDPDHIGSSRVPSRRLTRTGSHSPEIVRTISRKTRSPSPEPTVFVEDEPSHAPRSSRSHRQTIVMEEAPRESHGFSRDRSRSPIVIRPAPGESHRTRSPQRTIVVQQQPDTRARSRSRSPERIIMAPPAESHRTRSPRRTVIIQQPVSRARSRSRSPEIIMAPSEGRSRSYRQSPPLTISAPSRRRSRSPRTVIMQEESRSRSDSRERRRLSRRPRSYSRSPRQVIIRGPSRRSRSYRSRSPTYISSRRRSRSPQIIYADDGSRSPSRRTERVVMRSPRTSSPIFVDSEGHRRRPNLLSRLFSRRDDPTVIHTSSRRSPSTRRVLAKEPPREPPIIVADRPRSRAHSPRTRRRSRSLPPIVYTEARSYSPSPSRRYRRSPIQVIERSHGDRSRSPRDHDYDRSRYDLAEYDRGTHRSRSYSPGGRRLQRRSPSPHDSRYYSPPRRSRSMSRRHGSRWARDPSDYDRVTTRYGSRRDSPDYRPSRHYLSRRGSPPYYPSEYDRGTRRRKSSPPDSRYDSHEYDRGTRHADSPDGFLRRPRTRSRYDHEEYEEPRSSRRLTRLTLSPTRSRLTRPTPSPSPDETRPPVTHHSRQSPPVTVFLREEEEHPPSHAGTLRRELSTIHEGHSERTRSPSVIQVPAFTHRSRAGTTLRVTSPGIQSPSPSIIQLPSGEILRRTTPQMLRVTSPRPETTHPPPPTVVRVPSAPPFTPRSQVLRIGTSRAMEPVPVPRRSPTPERRPSTPARPTLITLPGQHLQPVRSQMIRVGGTPLPTAPMTVASPPAEHPPPSPAIIQLPSQVHEPLRSQTIRVGTPAIQPPVERPPSAPAIIQLPGQSRDPHRAQTIRVGTPAVQPPLEHPPSGQPPSTPAIIQLPGQLQDPHRAQTVRVGTPAVQPPLEQPPRSPAIIRLPEQQKDTHRAQTIRVGTPAVQPPLEQPPSAPAIIQLPSQPRDPHRAQTIRVGTPAVQPPLEQPPRSPAIIQLPEQQRDARAQTIRVGTPAVQPPPEQPPSTPAIIQLPGQQRDPHRTQTIRVGTPTVQPPVERPPTAPAIIQLPSQVRDPHRAKTIRVGTPAQPEISSPAPPTIMPAPSIIQLPGGGPSLGPQTVRVASPSPSLPAPPEPTIIRLQEQGELRPPTRSQTVRVGSPQIAPIQPSVIQLPGSQAPPDRVPASQLVRVGGIARQPTPEQKRTSPPPFVPPPEHIIQLPGSSMPQPPNAPAIVRVGGRPTTETPRAPSPTPLPPPTTIQLPSTGAPAPVKSPMVRVAAPSVATPAPSIAMPGPTVIRLPGTPSPTTPSHAFVRVPEGATGGLTEVPRTMASPGGVVRVEHTDRAPTVIQVASPSQASQFVRATPSPGVSVPGFVRARGVGTPGLARIPEVVRVGEHTPVPGASRTSLDRPPSDHYPEHRLSSIASVGREDIIAPVASRSSMAGRSIADDLDRMAREADEEAAQRRRRRGTAADAYASFEDQEARRQRQFEEFLESQRQENERLRETLFQMVPGLQRTRQADGAEPSPAHIDQLVTEAVETIKSHRDADRASIISLRDDEVRRDLENERARVKELEAELAQMREQLEQERSQRDVNVQDKCAEMHDAVNANHNEVKSHLGDLTNRMMECRDEFTKRAEMDEQRRAEKEARRAQKEAQQQQLQDLLQKMIADQEEERRQAEEERRRAAERMGLEQVIEELRQQNAEQQRLLVALLDEHRQANLQSHEATITAVREAVAQHVPMDIKGHLNEFSRSLAEEVRLLLREVGKLREEKRNIQYEIGCLLCLKSKYEPDGEFNAEWRPTTGPCSNGPPMPDAPAEEAPHSLEERPTTAPPAWRTIHQRRKPKRREQPAPPPMPMPSAPAPPAAPAVSAPPPPPSTVHERTPTMHDHTFQPSTIHEQAYQPSYHQQMMDHDRQTASWYQFPRDPHYAPSSPSTGPLYEVPETRPLGFFGPRSPRDSVIP